MMQIPLFEQEGRAYESSGAEGAGPLENAEAFFAPIYLWSEAVAQLPFAQQIEALNTARAILHAISPFRQEPVDCVQWIPAEHVSANDYNPNTVAPPEMALLELSIVEDGYTQPIVGWKQEEGYEVIDGFHRNRVGRESPVVRHRIHGYLPVVAINAAREDRGDRIASTIRHNRARGKHAVSAMSEIVIELKRRNWADARIAKELGMDQDEILRLCQITGLAELFADQEFSQSWDVEGTIVEEDFMGLTDDVETYGEEAQLFRVVNTDDPGRIFHPFTDWECYKAGLYATTKPGVSREAGEKAYQAFLSDSQAFQDALTQVITTWTASCEHYLTNVAMNRIAWLGQAAACCALGLPAIFRSGYHLLSPGEQQRADEQALEALNTWRASRNLPALSLEEAYSYDRQSDIY